MNSQIAKRTATPGGGALRGMWRDWAGAAVLLLVWTTLWTVFTAGVLAPASRLARGAGAAERTVTGTGPSARPAGLAVPPWVAAR